MFYSMSSTVCCTQRIFSSVCPTRRIFSLLFYRYGSPGSVTKEYKEFAEWYLKTFSGGILTSMLKNLDQFRRKIYVSPRVMQQALNYINTAISHAHSWKLIKPHMLQIIQDIVFPLMSYSESDADDQSRT